jgi:hypothetical protein
LYNFLNLSSLGSGKSGILIISMSTFFVNMVI